MEPFDPDMFPETIGIMRNVDSTDADAGVVETWDGNVVSPVPCYVRTDAERQMWVSNNMVTITDITVYLPTNPDLKKDDRLLRKFFSPYIRPLRPGETPPDGNTAPTGFVQEQFVYRDLVVMGRSRPIGYMDVPTLGSDPAANTPVLWPVACQMSE